MRKQLLFTSLALTLFAVPALAEEGQGGPRGDHKGSPRGEKMFEKHDTNGDGVISKDEFLADAEKRFVEMDADGNGEVTKDEAKAAFEKMREKMKEFRDKRGEGHEPPPPPPEEDKAE